MSAALALAPDVPDYSAFAIAGDPAMVLFTRRSRHVRGLRQLSLFDVAEPTPATPAKPTAPAVRTIQRDRPTAAAPVLSGADLARYERLYKDLLPGFINRARMMLAGDRGRAEDVAAEAFVKILRAWSRAANFSDEECIKWAWRILSNTAIDAQRRLQRERRTLRSLDDHSPTSAAPETPSERYDLLADDGAAPEQVAEIREALGEIADALDEFRAIGTRCGDRRISALLLAGQGYSGEEIGRLLRVDPNVAKSDVARARQAVRRILSRTA